MAAPILPENLQRELDDVARKYSLCIHTQQYDVALNIITDLYNRMLRWQEEHQQRFHKGYAIHNIGYTLYLQNKPPQEALRYFILAYIEDLLSADNEDEADLTPAGQTLLLGYKYEPKILKELKLIVATLKKQGKLPLIPEDVIGELGKSWQDVKGEITVVAPKVDDNPKWEKKVFIGGSGRLIPTINFMRDTVEKLGYYAVVAVDYVMPKEMNVYRKCLYLLNGCKYAIIDLSEQAGQLIEADRAAEYGIRTLVIWPKGREESITQMLKDAFEERGINNQSYERFPELEGIFREFLRES
jgi:hypothetical protein